MADECPLQVRAELRSILSPHLQRVRVITIDNQGTRLPVETEELLIAKSEPAQVSKVLEENYSKVPLDRRLEYARISGGFLSFAALLCRRDSKLVAEGHLGVIAPTVAEYLTKLLAEDDLKVLELLSLFERVGFSGELSGQLDNVCNLLNLDRAQIEETALRLHRETGLIGRSGRYLYVTPEIVAQATFMRGWQKFVDHQPEKFFQGLNGNLLEKFQARVKSSAPPAVREAVSHFFLQWAHNLKPSQLSDLDAVQTLSTLVEIDPDKFLPLLSRLVTTANITELREVSGRSGRGWDPRRSLVWLMERLARLPEYFSFAEEVLLRLALGESEPNIGNNASGIWKQLFRIHLSGTATSYDTRLELLERRLSSSDRTTVLLALDALDESFHWYGSRIVGSVLIAGRIAPDEWSPKTNQEYTRCISELLAALKRFAFAADSDLQEKASRIVTKHIRSLLAQGFLEATKNYFIPELLTDTVRALLLHGLGDVFEFDAPQAESAPQKRYFTQIMEWRNSLTPPGLHQRLVAAVAIQSWSYGKREEEWNTELELLAKILVSDEKLFRGELTWLLSDEAVSSFYLGLKIGILDREGNLLDALFADISHRPNRGLARGYVVGISAHTHLAERLAKIVDSVQEASPEVAFELYLQGGEFTDALQRTVRLVDDNRLQPFALGAFEFGIAGRGPLTDNEFREVLKRFQRDDIPDKRSINTAISIVAARLHAGKLKTTLSASHEIREMVWRIVELGADDAGNESFWWAEILKAIFPHDLEKALQIIVRATFFSERFDQRQLAEGLLQSAANTHPKEVMQVLGAVILDASEGWRFESGKHVGLIYSLPQDVLKNWLQENGLEAARKIARHLPPPFISGNGEPSVPEVTKFVMEEWGNDKQVFQGFYLGIHNLQMYVGSMADHKRKEAEIATKFLNYPIPSIRKWAQFELANATAQAEHFQQSEEEEGF